jgi:hypothetical protein
MGILVDLIPLTQSTAQWKVQVIMALFSFHKRMWISWLSERFPRKPLLHGVPLLVLRSVPLTAPVTFPWVLLNEDVGWWRCSIISRLSSVRQKSATIEHKSCDPESVHICNNVIPSTLQGRKQAETVFCLANRRKWPSFHCRMIRGPSGTQALRLRLDRVHRKLRDKIRHTYRQQSGFTTPSSGFSTR